MAFLRQRRKLRLFLIFVVVLCLGFGVYRIQLERLVKRSEDAYMAMGYPLDLAKLNDWYPAVPDSENAALLYVAASEHVKFEDDDYDKLPYFGDPDDLELGPPMSEEMRARMASFLERNAEVYRLLHDAASYPRSRYPMDLSEGHAADTSHLGQARSNARWLGFESLYKSEIADREGAVQALIALFAVGRSLADEPVFISVMVRSAVDGIAMGALTEALDRTSFEDGQLKRLSEAVKTSRRSVGLAEICAVDLCGSYAGIKKQGSTDIDDWKRGLDATAVFLYSELPWLGKTWLVLRNWAGAHLYARLQFLDVARDSMEHATLLPLEAYEHYSTATYDGWIGWDTNFLASSITYFWPSMIQVMQSNEARLSVVQTALAVERFRLSEDRLPYELLELVPEFLDEIPLDSFTGRPLGYLQLDDGYRVYSVGTNFLDEHGNGHTSGDRDLGDDIGIGR